MPFRLDRWCCPWLRLMHSEQESQGWVGWGSKIPIDQDRGDDMVTLDGWTKDGRLKERTVLNRPHGRYCY